MKIRIILQSDEFPDTQTEVLGHSVEETWPEVVRVMFQLIPASLLAHGYVLNDEDLGELLEEVYRW